ncbi:hypothetical protein C8Q74DRAFT_1305000 [Fomes fomentarius]|nr:hypothetical protein C8Q74DRAFT_1305000 [Fomes fomentarius]
MLLADSNIEPTTHDVQSETNSIQVDFIAALETLRLNCDNLQYVSEDVTQIAGESESKTVPINVNERVLAHERSGSRSSSSAQSQESPATPSGPRPVTRQKSFYGASDAGYVFKSSWWLDPLSPETGLTGAGLLRWMRTIGIKRRSSETTSVDSQPTSICPSDGLCTAFRRDFPQFDILVEDGGPVTVPYIHWPTQFLPSSDRLAECHN